MKREALFLLAIACVLLLSAPAAAQPDPGQRFEDLCGVACDTGICTTDCRIGTNWTTCGVYWGNPANDLDSDGVGNGGDNCVCVANSNQANCDGDAFGDACDGQDNSWHKIATGTQACEVDVDDHGYEEEIEIYYADTYQSSCTGATCKKKHRVASFDCGLFQNADLDCCLDNWFYSDCTIGWNFDNCGTPRCNF